MCDVPRCLHGPRGSRLSWVGCRATCLLMLAVAPLTGITQSLPGAPGAQKSDLADFLLSKDLVVDGTLVSITPTTHRPEGGCGISGESPHFGNILTVRIDSILVGRCPDSLVALFRYGVLGELNSEPYVLGQHVIAHGLRPCSDPDTYWGSATPIQDDGTVGIRFWDRMRLREAPTSKRITYRQLIHVLAQRGRDPLLAMEGALAVALVRVKSFEAQSPDSFVIECDSLAMLAGVAPRVPSHLHFPAIPDCGVMLGDSLAVPIRVPGTSVIATLNLCPYRLRVQDRRIPVLGTSIDQVDTALRSGPGRLHVLNRGKP